VKFLRSERGLAVIAALLLVLFLFRPGIHQLRNRIANSIGSALGRRVAIDDVRLRVLPRPGFDLEGLVIYDEPVFGAEPMIRAQDVFAAIRLRSLLRGRLEIAKMSATEPSINIVCNSQGRWNIAGLIERNALIPAAPTQKPPSESRPAFPYLEATGARINFKIGQEKKSYALTDADVALWQDSENSWGARMKAQPVRTDLNLTDTGLLLIEANWQRSRNLRLTPMRLTLAWENGQLGQITALLSGQDRGWRGAVTLTADISGTPRELAVDSRLAIGGFRRYDIVDSRSVNLATGCTGQFSATNRSLNDLACKAPVSGGLLRLRGKMDGKVESGNASAGVAVTAAAPRDYDRATYDLILSVEKVPIPSALALFQVAKRQLPGDLAATGVLDGEFRAVRKGAEPAQLSGTIMASDIQLVSNNRKDTIALGNFPLTLVGNSNFGGPGHRGATLRAKVKDDGKEAEPADAHLRIGPASLQVNTSAPDIAGGWISASGYSFFLRGDLEFRNLFRLESILGVPAVRPAVEGDARLDVSISGNWRGLAAPNALGTAQLRNVRAETHGLNSPIVISSATVVLGPDMFSMQKVVAQTGETHWTGSIAAPRHCAPACVYQFDLAADHLSAEDLAEWFTPHPAKRPWYRILNSVEPPGPSPFLALQAHGKLRVARLDLKKLVASQAASQLSIDRGKVTLTGLRATILQGTHQGNWTVDASILPPRYRGSGTLENVALGQLGTLMNDAWIAGSADGSFELNTAGGNVQELVGNSEGKLRFVMRNGSLARIQIPGMHGPLSVHRFAGELRAKKGIWELSDGRLESRNGLYQVSGTAEPENGLNFVLTRSDDQSWNLTGTLAMPRVTPANQEISRKDASSASEPKP
jgi:hypothetical protein